MIDDHAEHRASAVDYDESKIARGALLFSKKTARDVATPIAEVDSVERDDEIDLALLNKIKREGHSRLPVIDANGQYVGIVYTKDLLGREFGTPIGHVYRDKIYDMPDDTALDTALSRFIQTKSHLFLVHNDDEQVIGVITLEDVIEEIINREIEDEHDA